METVESDEDDDRRRAEIISGRDSRGRRGRRDTITGEHFIDGRTTEADGRRDGTVIRGTRERARRDGQKRTADDRQSAGTAILLCLIVNARTLTIWRAVYLADTRSAGRE